MIQLKINGTYGTLGTKHRTPNQRVNNSQELLIYAKSIVAKQRKKNRKLSFLFIPSFYFSFKSSVIRGNLLNERKAHFINIESEK